MELTTLMSPNPFHRAPADGEANEDLVEDLVDDQKYEIAEHCRRIRQRSMFLRKEKEAPKITGRWVSNDKGDYSALVKRYWEEQENEATNSLWTAQKPDKQGMLSYVTGRTMATILQILDYLLVILGIKRIGAMNSPNLGALYDCRAAIIKDVFAAPSEKTYMDSFEVEKALKYQGWCYEEP